MISQHSFNSCMRSNNKNITKVYNNNNKNNNNNNVIKKLFAIKLTFVGIFTLLTLTKVNVQGAAIFTNADFSHPSFEPICNTQDEHFIESDGKESSLILEFNPGVLAEKKTSCTRILSTTANYGFIVRLILPKIRRGFHQTPPTITNNNEKTKTISALNEMTSLIEKINSTALKSGLGRSCPISVFSSFDPHIPQWRLDPCQIEDTAPDMEDPVRLFHGRVRIVWEHEHQTLNSKLMVTVLGKGEQCRNEKKHQCLKIGDEPILCISKDLVCDGIRHCPNSNEYDSDEDYAMCWKHRRVNDPISTAMESDIFEHFALEVFRNLFAFDAPTMPDKRNRTAVGANSTTLRKVPGKTDNNTINSDGELTDNSNGTKSLKNSTEHAITNVGTGHHRRNSTRLGLNSDLSKYGPWGYLMLGMLLCGGALLICGLWVCCCRLSLHIQTIRSLSASASQHAANNERESALQNGTSGMPGSHVHPSNNAGPPNYEELDPPPAYSVLFPNQKAASSNTLSSMGATTTAAGAAAAAASSGIAVAAAAVIPPQAEAAVAPVTDSTTTTTTTITPNITAASAQENVDSVASN
ncbi:uncharacterized protein LOC119677757 isoform X1 [Teleopsis dalmanni]|uniref:uncharacterized protein LOC119677757 isoform X1 n=2 Tax=Teleopsis dalmanni TaxID=139649 RepID=UPI0018CDBA13|nr:uncharacterized protein LOC119677757 isoform X1 [Teleopsis dalmanni]